VLTKDKVTHCRMDEASLFKFGKWDKDGRLHSLTEVKNFPWKERVLGHVMLLQILNPRSVFLEWMKLCTLFKFSKWIDCSKSHHRGEKFPLKGAWSGSCPWKGHGLGHVPERGMVWVMSLKGAWSGSCPWKGHGLGHVTLLKILSPLQYVWSGWSYTL